MRIVYTCGGTAGHINPALTMAAGAHARRPDAEILFCGSRGGMEEKLVAKAGYPIRTIPMQGFSRKLTPKALIHNLKTGLYTLEAVPKAKKILQEFRPDICVGTGGYACFPFLVAAHRMGIPTMVHESNALAGKSVLALEDVCDRILLGFDAARDAFRDPQKPIWTGNPMTGALQADRAEVRRKYGIPEDIPLVLSAWGSLGAREMNKATADLLELAQEDDSFLFMHATGSFGYRWFPALLEERNIHRPNTDVREYIYGLSELMYAADVILCRAGAMTMSEVCAAGLPAIIVPSPNVAENHQEKNARTLEKAGAARVVLEKDCTGQALYGQLRELLDDEELRRRMHTCGQTLAVYDAEERIWNCMTELLAASR